MFLWGFSGSGKTAISMETVKIKVSHCKEKNKSVRVIVTKYSANDDEQLLTVMREYLRNIDVQILTLHQLSKDLNCKVDFTQPKDTINAVIRSLSSDKTDQLTIFVCDEVPPCDSRGQTTPDWTDLATADNVEWILSMSPVGGSTETINMKPPSGPSILDRKLLHGHRNSYPIRSVSSSSLYFAHCIIHYRQIINWFNSHYWKENTIPTDDEEKLPADQLPPGTTPLWYDAPKGYPKRAILEKISESEEISGLSVTVIYYTDKDRDEGAAEFCQEKGWNYRDWEDMQGCEDECIIVMDCLQPETISRPHNLLVVVTTPGAR